MQEEMTQEMVNEAFAEIKAEWDAKFKESGRDSVAMFVMLDNTGWVANFLATHQQLKDHLHNVGLEMPEIEGLNGLKITLS